MSAGHWLKVQGRGSAEIAAYGVADAEHQVEKEIRGCWPEARVQVTGIDRTGEGRIVEEFQVRYQVSAPVLSAGDSDEEARADALRQLRRAFLGTRHARIEWTRVDGSGSAR